MDESKKPGVMDGRLSRDRRNTGKIKRGAKDTDITETDVRHCIIASQLDTMHVICTLEP